MNISRGDVSKKVWRWQGKRREAWGYTFRVDGKRVRKLGFDTKTAAQAALDQAKDEARRRLELRPLSLSLPPMTVTSACERYLAMKKAQRRKSMTEMERHARDLRHYLGADTPVANVTAARVAELRERLLARESPSGGSVAAATVNRTLAFLRSVLRAACFEWETIERVPRIKLEKEPAGNVRWFTPEEYQRILAECEKAKNPALADLFIFSCHTGLRQGEALRLRWQDVDRARGVILVAEAKSGKPREVPLATPADAVLARRAAVGARDDDRVFLVRRWAAIRTSWEAALKRARVLDASWHTCRHTAASWLVQAGASLAEVKAILGHASLAMTMRYSHLAKDHLRSAVARLDGFVARGGQGQGELAEPAWAKVDETTETVVDGPERNSLV